MNRTRNPLPCPICGKPVEIKWTAGMSKDLVELAGHPTDGSAGWYLDCCQGRVFEPMWYPATYENQQKKKRSLIRKWNKAVTLYNGIKGDRHD